MCYVRAKQRLRRACDVRARLLWDLRVAIATSHQGGQIMPIFLDDLASLLWDDQFSLFNYLLMIMYRVTTKLSYNFNVNLWLIGSCE